VTLFSGDSVLVSLPGAEVGSMSLPGSFAEPEAVLANPLSLELRSALEILHQEARRRNLPITCVARPEVFTHSISEAWFRDRISLSAQHVCLSDGSTVKHLPGVPTHVFFYCLSFRSAIAALQLLSRRAPELMIKLCSQINTSVVLGQGTHRTRPTSAYLPRTTPLRQPPSTLLPFFLNRDSAEDSANRIEHAGPVEVEGLTGFTRVLYLPLTEASLDDRAFAQAVLDLILQTFIDLTTLLILRLPADAQMGPSLARGIATLLAVVRQSGLVLPRSSPANILFTTRDLEEDHVLFERFPLHIVLHESFDFWRHTVDYYARAHAVTVLAEPESAAKAGLFRFDVTSIYGAKGVRQWVVDPADVD
jgi:hypothetical protein